MTPNDAIPDAPIDRRDYLRLAGGLAAGATAGIAGCAGSVPGGDNGDSSDGESTTDDDGDGSTATGLLSTAVSDDPGDIGDFESCIVTLDGVWVGPRAGSEGGEDEAGADGAGKQDAEDGPEDTDDGETDDTEQTDGSGQPEDANSSSDDEASGSQDDGNQTDTDDGTESDVDEGQDGEEETEEAGDEDEAGEDGEQEDEGEDDSSGRTYYEFDEPQEADLTKLQGDAQQLVGEHELAVGTYQFLQLDVGGVRGTLTDGSEADVTTPGNAPLKFNESFDVREGYRTSFLADFTPVKRGNGSYLFKPVAAETTVSYEEISGGDGSEKGTDSDGSTDGDDSASDDDATDGDDSASDGEATDGENTSDVDDSETTDGGSADGGGNETTA